MKKIILLFMFMFFPYTAYAYSNEVYLGGNTIGIKINSDGVLIVGFYKIDGKVNESDLKIGDYITKVNNVSVSSLANLTSIIEEYATDGKVTITYKRDDLEYNTTLNLIEDNGVYKTGLYVKDEIIGIGTLTYIDPETLVYGSLGHEIIESNTNKVVEIKDGTIFRNSIIALSKSTIGNAGSKNAKYYYDDVYGSIITNTNHGIFGEYSGSTDDFELIKVGTSEDIKVGEAYIYTVIDSENIEKFTINITSINETSDTKNINFEITDKKLIDKTGGVIQGMSGSPIVQNNLLVGVVTHVIVDNPITGYGLFITTMLEEGDKNT